MEEKINTVKMHRTIDTTLNPLKNWVHTMRRILKIPGAKRSLTISIIAVWANVKKIAGADSSQIIKNTLNTTRKDDLAFVPENFGIHSNCLTTVMAIYLSNMVVFTVILVKQWSPGAFLLNTWKQVQELTVDVSTIW